VEGVALSIRDAAVHFSQQDEGKFRPLSIFPVPLRCQLPPDVPFCYFTLEEYVNPFMVNTVPMYLLGQLASLLYIYIYIYTTYGGKIGEDKEVVNSEIYEWTKT
jgi:hypothetical protein